MEPPGHWARPSIDRILGIEISVGARFSTSWLPRTFPIERCEAKLRTMFRRLDARAPCVCQALGEPKCHRRAAFSGLLWYLAGRARRRNTKCESPAWTPSAGGWACRSSRRSWTGSWSRRSTLLFPGLLRRSGLVGDDQIVAVFAVSFNHRWPARVATATMERSCGDAALKSMMACLARSIQVMTWF